MDANLRVDRSISVWARAHWSLALGLLLLLLSACSMLAEVVPGGDASVRGAVLSDDYALEVLALSQGQLQQSSLASPAASARVLGAPSSEVPRATAPDALGATSPEVFRAPSPQVLRAPAPENAYVPGEVLVVRRSGSERLSALDLGSRRPAPELVELGPLEGVPSAINRLSRDPEVELASPNYYIYPTALPNDPYLPQQWSLPSAGIPVTWGEPGENQVVVAVVDSGFDLDHEDLEGVFLPGYDFCGNSDCSATDSDPSNGSAGNWHGTHVAGVVAAVGDNGLGVKGVADSRSVRILPVKIFNDEGGGANTQVLIEGLRWAAGLPVDGVPVNAQPARVINLSLAGDFSSEILQATIDEVRAAGALVVASTGNAGVDRVMSPAAAAGVVAVGSINSDFERSCFSNYGVGSNGPGGVDILAPGGEADGSIVPCGISPYEVEGLMSSIPGDAYGSAVGTSMAAPMVSAAAALILSHEPELSVAELERRLLDSAYFDPDSMNEAEYGAGVLRADRALGYLGPGDSVVIELTETSSGAGRQLPLTLGVAPGGAEFSFDGIAPGRYQLRAVDPESTSLVRSLDLALAPGEQLRTNLILEPGL
ncbi:MAG TPA: S8 family serine peptidase [Trueperaceae bacterium]